MRVVPTLFLALVVGALAAAPASASAATIVVRPNATQQLPLPWSVSAAGKTADAVLADAVTRPALPSTTGDLLSAGTGWDSVTVGFPSPGLPAGTTPTAVTAWVYASVGPLQTLTPTLSSGTSVLGWRLWLAGGAAWRSIALSPVPTAAQLSNVSLALRSDGLAGTTTTKVYAAYLQIDAPSADAAATGTPTAGGDTAAGAAGDDVEVSGTPSGPAGPLVVAPATVELAATATTVPLQVSCPAGTAGGCRGRVRIELAAAKAKRGAKARAARCARGCRVIGDSPFTIAAGKQRPVRVKLRPAAYKALPRGRTVRAQVTISSRDQRNRAVSVTRSVAIHRARF